jgi:hypothetical protein
MSTVSDGARPAAEEPAPAPPRGNGADVAAAPPFPLPDLTRRAWREETLARAAEMTTLANWLSHRAEAEGGRSPADRAVDDGIRWHLTAAREAAGDARSSSRSGARHARAASNLDAAEADLLRLVPLAYLQGQLPSLQAHVRRHLPLDDPRRHRVEKLADEVKRGPLTDIHRESIIGAVRAASSAAQREHRRVRSFCTIVLAGTAVLFAMALLVGALGSLKPELLAVCFEPQEQQLLVCPTGETALEAGDDVDDKVGETVTAWDVPLIEVVGMVAAAVTGAVALRRMRGTSTPFAVPVALTVLKLPTGALTAFLGLLLMRGGFVPGLTALDSTPQILAWAVVFGASQQLVTGLVDRQAQTVLDSVGNKTYTPSGGS